MWEEEIYNFWVFIGNLNVFIQLDSTFSFLTWFFFFSDREFSADTKMSNIQTVSTNKLYLMCDNFFLAFKFDYPPEYRYNIFIDSIKTLKFTLLLLFFNTPLFNHKSMINNIRKAIWILSVLLSGFRLKISILTW